MGQNPKPTLTSLLPDNASTGSAGFTLIVKGTNFISTSAVNWPDPSRYNLCRRDRGHGCHQRSGHCKGRNFKVTVTNPAPGGGTSVASNFTVVNPAPTLISISPSSATHGGKAFTLTATGTNYISGSAIEWNAKKLITTYVSSTTLTATVPATDIKTAGTASVTVVTPAPGGGTSAAKTFTIN